MLWLLSPSVNLPRLSHKNREQVDNRLRGPPTGRAMPPKVPPTPRGLNLQAINTLDFERLLRDTMPTEP